jgi:hypothetical protein
MDEKRRSMPNSTRPPVERVPWGRIAIVLTVAALAAWVLGFVAGLIVRFQFGA